MPLAYLKASDSLLQWAHILEGIICSDARLLAERTLLQVRRTGEAPVMLCYSLLGSVWDIVKASQASWQTAAECGIDWCPCL